ncbi:hypothetical protein BU17DRAFT_93451 [Hysterangium stoloniferum]|nr:hypothetical protein BU17DRAFT_93451 [Hysterangium stoloniferum]
MKPLGFTKPIVVRSGITLTAVIILAMFLCFINVNTASQRILSVILHHCVSHTQFKVLDILTDMSILLGYQLPRFNQGFRPVAAAVTGFKLLAKIELNLEQAARLFGLLPVSDMKHSLYSVCYNDVLHPFSKGSLPTVLMNKPFKGGPSSVAHLPHALRVRRGDNLSHAAVIGDACIALICIALVFTLFGAILHFIHSRLQNAHVADHAPAVDDGNVEGIHPADHPPAVDAGHVEGMPDDHPPAVDDRNVEGNDPASNSSAVDDGDVKGTHADSDSTPRISWEYKGKGVDPREYCPLMLNGSLFTGSYSQRFQGPNAGTFHPHIVPKANTTIAPSHKLPVIASGCASTTT